jgi:hypothetical protein
MVTSCGDQMDYRALQGCIKGAAVAGIWSIFEEQFASVLTACKANAESFQYIDGELINLDKRVGYFIAYNPGYKRRAQLPASLEALFRFVTMTVPNRNSASPAMLDRGETLRLCFCPCLGTLTRVTCATSPRRQSL